MAFLYAYPDVDPYPTTHVAHTFPEKGHHLRHIPIPYLAHKAHKIFHDKDQDVHVPRTDVRETPKSFYVEVELPGIKDKTELHLRWTSTRTLLVTSKITRPEIPESEMVYDPDTEGILEPTPTEEEREERPVEGGEAKKEEETPAKLEPHLTVHERLIGDYMRAFNFPVDVDRDETHAKLDAGLLKVIVPKLTHGTAISRHVSVNVHDGDSTKEAPPA
ncbi:hypothetical protein PV08_00583 [Exophiala spinifera]|uniref:SHSP domain-containing protein n=1 Tax=Exophiala spinifera TaxID=91928 RepID=A0A0D2BM84_9EURO|nr:uncharacterized protein PV08_00583 [Exophiala spinifera]KIW20008.1 hypothetical protein PV08_00583 [Exophiala spinifera]